MEMNNLCVGWLKLKEAKKIDMFPERLDSYLMIDKDNGEKWIRHAHTSNMNLPQDDYYIKVIWRGDLECKYFKTMQELKDFEIQINNDD